MRASFIALFSSSLLLSACASMGGGDGYGGGASDISSASAALRGTSGQFNGETTITQLDGGIRVVIRGSGLPQGVHGAHIHQTGTCAPPDFSSAGGHWNPQDRGHGRNNPAGQHMGDMPNLIVGADGTGLIELTIDDAQISGGRMPLLDSDGAAIVIHAAPDDYVSDPSGNAGARIACGVIEPAY